MAATLHVGIIGGGSVGVSVLCQLVQALAHRPHPPPVCIHLFEPRAVPGAGDAYADDIETNLLNIPADNMSAFGTDPGHFLEWLQTRPAALLREFRIDQVRGSDFLPRPLFGRYLEWVYGETLARAEEQGLRIIHHRTLAIDVRRRGPNVLEVYGKDGSVETVGRLVLCNGNLPSAAFPHVHDQDGYFNSPYPVRALGAVDPQAPVAILGSSLSAIDAIVGLESTGHRGPIVCYSRNGRLPSVRSPHPPDRPAPRFSREEFEARARRHGGMLTLEAVFDMLAQRLQELGGALDPEDAFGIEGPAAAGLDDEIRRALAGPRLWQAVLGSTNDVVEFAWNLLAPAEKARFMQTWRSLWMARRATFPMQNAVQLQKLFHQGRLGVLGGFQGVEREDGRFMIRHRNGEGRLSGSRYPYVVNATSFSVDISRSTDPLIRALVRSGQAVSNPYGGFQLDFETGCLVGADGKIRPEISVVGSLAMGTYFWTISMVVNARLAWRQCGRLADELAAMAAAPAGPQAPRLSSADCARRTA